MAHRICKVKAAEVLLHVIKQDVLNSLKGKLLLMNILLLFKIDRLSYLEDLITFETKCNFYSMKGIRDLYHWKVIKLFFAKSSHFSSVFLM